MDTTHRALGAMFAGVVLLALASVPAVATERDAAYAAVTSAIDSAIGAFVDAQPDIGARGPWCIERLTDTKEALVRAAAAEARGSRRAASSALRGAGRRLIGVAFRLRSLNARKTVPRPTREGLLATIRPIQAEVRTLRRTL